MNGLRKRRAGVGLGEFEIPFPSNFHISGFSDDAEDVVWLEKRGGTGAGTWDRAEERTVGCSDHYTALVACDRVKKKGRLGSRDKHGW